METTAATAHGAETGFKTPAGGRRGGGEEEDEETGECVSISVVSLTFFPLLGLVFCGELRAWI